MEIHPDHDKYINGIRNKDRKVIEEIYEKFLNGIIQYVRRNSGTRDDGMDYFQNALEKIVKKAFHTSFTLPVPFGVYLFGVCRNLWREELKKRKKMENRVSNMDWEGYTTKEAFEKLIEETIDGDRWLSLQARTLQQLTQLCQKLLTLFQQGKDVTEIANTLDMNANAIYRRKNACKKSWREAMENDSDFRNCNPFEK